MSAPNSTRWIGIGLLGLPLYGALTFWSSIDPQPDPNTHLEAWSRYVTTNHYVLGHLLGSILGLSSRSSASSPLVPTSQRAVLDTWDWRLWSSRCWVAHCFCRCRGSLPSLRQRRGRLCWRA